MCPQNTCPCQKNKQVKEGLEQLKRELEKEGSISKRWKEGGGEDWWRHLSRSLRPGRISEGRRKRLLHSSVCHSRVNLEIAELRRKERETHFRRETRIAFVASEGEREGRKDPFFFTRFSARGHASSGRNNIGKWGEQPEFRKKSNLLTRNSSEIPPKIYSTRGSKYFVSAYG